MFLWSKMLTLKVIPLNGIHFTFSMSSYDESISSTLWTWLRCERKNWLIDKYEEVKRFLQRESKQHLVVSYSRVNKIVPFVSPWCKKTTTNIRQRVCLCERLWLRLERKKYGGDVVEGKFACFWVRYATLIKKGI